MSSKKFTDLNAGTIGAGSIFAQAQEPALSGDPYTSTKVSATQIANYVAKGQAFTELNNQTIVQAISGGSGAGTVILTMAQYIALTPAQQTDGHIYVISDFACIFCYGRQYRAMQELTQAEYDQLSPAEQNNGTLYIITDEETTAADIPYSSGVSVADKLDNVPTFDTLTTGDNNKLLGVSVSGDDISVEAVETNCYVSKIKFIHFENVVVASALNPVGVIKSNAIESNILSTTYQFLQVMDSSSGRVYGAYIRKDNGNICAGETMPASNSYQIAGFIYLA